MHWPRSHGRQSAEKSVPKTCTVQGANGHPRTEVDRPFSARDQQDAEDFFPLRDLVNRIRLGTDKPRIHITELIKEYSKWECPGEEVHCGICDNLYAQTPK
ncbi:hypothetical protein JTE90_002200 [Oedothorax gibbosus]|uniref:Uncharacterized protein n=1 Tax=Oedothorax gibbosus TaxID=931172 RepID=A0AAV6VHN0_9ARAC|nr:hypothetical protein JTE90_002200 [Oedothorax gibbosus]